VRKGGYLLSAASMVDTGYCQSGTTLRRIGMLCHVKQHHPNRQTWKGLGRKKGTLVKDERYLYNEVERLLYTEERKSVLMMRIRNQWTRGTMSGI
jgi:hypothetical protein